MHAGCVCRFLVTSLLCGHYSPCHGFHHHRSICSAGASWDIGAWKRWAGRWCSREAECYYWSHCGSRCPCRRQHCLDRHLRKHSGMKHKVRKPDYSCVQLLFCILVNNYYSFLEGIYIKLVTAILTEKRCFPNINQTKIIWFQHFQGKKNAPWERLNNTLALSQTWIKKHCISINTEFL